jgi:hypothetical protein
MRASNTNCSPRLGFLVLTWCLGLGVALQQGKSNRRSIAPHHYHASLDFNKVDGGTDDAARRKLILASLGGLATTFMLPPLTAMAAPPMTNGEAEGLGAQFDRKFRSKPPKILRSKLEIDFAVLLMRASYNALDQIDCVAMEQFQRDFFLIRQAEYQPYIELLGPGVVQQGMLVDPYYFDFISFAQYATISREIHVDPASVFEEQQPEEVGEDQPQKFVPVVIKRDPDITNDMLATRHSQLVGKAIIDKLDETFGSTASGIPKIPQGALNAEALLASIGQLTKLFLVNGFAFDGNVSIVKDDSSGTELCISLINPATLWSGKALQRRKADPTNCFILKAACELATRAGLTVASSSVKYDGNQEKTYIKIR